MRWLFAKLRWIWKEPTRQARTTRSFPQQLHGESSLSWEFRPEITSLDQWMDLNA